MVLIGLVYYCFLENLILKIPSHVIHISKKDVINIHTCDVSADIIGVNLTGSPKIDLSNIQHLSK